MKVHKILIPSLLALLSISITFESKASQFEVCMSCTQTEMESVAKNLGSGVHRVGDLQSGIAKEYIVYIEDDGPFAMEFVQEQSLDTETRRKFSEASSAWHGLLSALTQTPQIPASIAGSAWDLPGNSQTRRLAGEWFMNNQTWNQQIGNYTAVIFAIVGEFAGVNFLVELDFSDGSVATYKVTGINNNGEITISLVSAIDEFGNDIPIVSAAIAGTYNFGTVSDVSALSSAGNNMGATMTFSFSNNLDGELVSVTCVQKGDNVYECTGR